MGEVGMHGVDEKLEDVALLLSQRLGHREHALEEAAAGGAVSAEARLAQDHAVPKRSLGAIMPRPELCRVGAARRTRASVCGRTEVFTDAA